MFYEFWHLLLAANHNPFHMLTVDVALILGSLSLMGYGLRFVFVPLSSSSKLVLIRLHRLSAVWSEPITGSIEVLRQDLYRVVNILTPQFHVTCAKFYQMEFLFFSDTLLLSFVTTWAKVVTKLLQSTKFFSLLAKSIMEVDYANFSFVRGEFLADGSYFILYMSQSDAILLEIQPLVTNISLKQSIKKCLEVIDRFDIEPVLAVITDKTSLSASSTLSPVLEKPHWQTFNSTFWAKKCLIISKEAFGFSDNEANKLDPLVAFTIYFFSDEKQRQKLRDSGNPILKHIDEFQ